MSQNIGFNPDLTVDRSTGNYKYSNTNPNWSGSVNDEAGYPNKSGQPPPYAPTAPVQPSNNRPAQYQVDPSQTDASWNRNAYNPNASVATNVPPGGTGAAADGQWGQLGAGGGLSDKNIRIRFIRKVYLIVTGLLIFTFGVVAIFVFVDPVKAFAKTSAGLALYIVSACLFLGLTIVFAICSCTQGLRRVPFNYIILFAIATTLAIMLGFVSAYHTIQAVIIAVGITLLITAGVTVFAMQTKFDFTKSCWLVAICLTFALIGFGIACIFVRNNILQAVYGGLGAVVMAIFLAIDTQMIIGGKRYKYSEEDYINAALQLYLDICYIFMYILQIMGAVDR